MQNDRRVVDMVVEVLKASSEPTKAMRRGPLHDKGAQHRDEDLPRKRAKEHRRPGVLAEAAGGMIIRYEITRGRLYG